MNDMVPIQVPGWEEEEEAFYAQLVPGDSQAIHDVRDYIREMRRGGVTEAILEGIGELRWVRRVGKLRFERGQRSRGDAREEAPRRVVCPVKLHGEHERAEIHGEAVEPPLTPEQHGALVLLIGDFCGGGPGLTAKDLKGRRPGISRLCSRHEHWRAILHCPAGEGRRGKPGRYRIKAA